MSKRIDNFRIRKILLNNCYGYWFNVFCNDYFQTIKLEVTFAKRRTSKKLHVKQTNELTKTCGQVWDRCCSGPGGWRLGRRDSAEDRGGVIRQCGGSEDRRGELLQGLPLALHHRPAPAVRPVRLGLHEDIRSPSGGERWADHDTSSELCSYLWNPRF